jgi:hypothetical protein
MKTSIIKLSICQCGYPLFKDSVKLGDEYDVDLSRRRMGSIKCGGCGMDIPTMGIWTEGNGDAGWLPGEAFDL